MGASRGFLCAWEWSRPIADSLLPNMNGSVNMTPFAVFVSPVDFQQTPCTFVGSLLFVHHNGTRFHCLAVTSFRNCSSWFPKPAQACRRKPFFDERDDIGSKDGKKLRAVSSDASWWSASSFTLSKTGRPSPFWFLNLTLGTGWKLNSQSSGNELLKNVCIGMEAHAWDIFYSAQGGEPAAKTRSNQSGESQEVCCLGPVSTWFLRTASNQSRDVAQRFCNSVCPIPFSTEKWATSNRR